MASYRLVHVKGNTWYIPSASNTGVYVKNGRVVLVDSGNNDDAGRKILKAVEEKGWELSVIVNTHSNADHIGGNALLQKRTGCRIAATQMESAFIRDPVLAPAFLYGARPFDRLRNKFLEAKPSTVTDVIPSCGKILESGLEAVPLPGHYFDMIGVKTPDGVFFTADSFFPRQVIDKYHIFFLYNVADFLATLEKLKNHSAGVFIPGHGEPSPHISFLLEVNRAKVHEISNTIMSFLARPLTEEEIFARVCTRYNIQLNSNQFVLVSSTVKSFLSYLNDQKAIVPLFRKGKMLWEKSSELESINDGSAESRQL
ncbi:MAG: MBL fold metallo-hydrolase [Spirochaetota bacterium]